MERDIKENGLLGRTLEKAMGYKFGLMEVNMRAGGKKIRQTVEDDLFMLMAMSLKEIGSMIRLMGMEFILI